MKVNYYSLLLVLLFSVITTSCGRHVTAEKESAYIQLSTTDSVDGFALLEMLNNNGLSLIVYNDGYPTGHSSRGIYDLLTLINEQPKRLQGAVVADKITGKASASILIAGGIRALFTNVICSPAKQMLENAGVEVYCREEVPMIKNRAGNGQCPMDARLQNIESADEALEVLRDFSASISNSEQ